MERKFEQWGEGQKQERKEKPKKKKIVEVGTRYGMPFFVAGDRQLKTEDLYVSVDQEKESAALTKQKMKSRSIQGESLIADARKMPFLSDTIDEVIFTNVFGELGKKDIQTHLDLIKETVRVLKSGGKLIINETYTPEKVPENMEVGRTLWGKLKVPQSFFENFGLTVDSSTADLEEISKYNKKISFDKDAFQLILRKR